MREETLLEKIRDKINDTLPEWFFRLKFKIKDSLFNLKQRCQKFKRGYSDIEVWNINTCFIENYKKILQQLLDKHVGYPATCTDDEWERILERMLFLLGEMDEDTCTEENSYKEEFMSQLMNKQTINEEGYWKSDVSKDLEKNYYDRENELFEYRDKCKNEFFKLFSKWFWNL